MTASFVHLDSGTPEAQWHGAGLERLPALAASDRVLVVLAAHPDDESLGAGGLIAASARLGARIVVVVASDGEASHPDSPTRTPAELAAVRRREVRDAVEALAPAATVHQLGLPDGALAEHEAAIEAHLRTVLGDGPARLVTPWCGDRHPDHQACADAAARVALGRDVEHWQYPIWLWHWGDPRVDLPAGTRRLDLSDADRAAKRRALAAHVSQRAPLSALPGDEAILPVEVLAHFDRAYECFVVGPAPASRPEYFDALYANDPDPWGLGERFYEQRKRDVVLASLPRRRFRRVFEPGCATGLLTRRLVERADVVVAWDVAPRALQQAAARLAFAPPDRVELARGRIPAEWPAGPFDLIVLSEVGYYCDDLSALVDRVVASLGADGVVVGCHWARRADDHPHQAQAVHAAFDAVLPRIVHHVEDDFLLDVWSATGESVATIEGIV